MNTLYIRYLLCITILPHSVVPKDPQQIFFGGSISYHLTELSPGNISATVELITGWELGKGPCGPNCSKASIGQSTLPYRAIVDKDNDVYFGDFTTDYKANATSPQTIRPMNSIVKANMTETVIAVSENALWEQELLTFTFALQQNTPYEDMNFDGRYWRKLTFQNQNDQLDWHLQTRIRPGIRNDTGKPNHCPVVLTRPFYRIKLDQTTRLELPAIDDDGDFVKCRDSQFVESGKMDKARGVNVTTNCAIEIHAFAANGYKNDSWIAVPIMFQDYPITPVLFGVNIQSTAFSMCTTAAQIVVNVVDRLVTPVFVSPTLEENHIFVIFVGAIWTTEVYAQAPNATTIDEFTVTVRRQENIRISSLRNHNEIGPLVRSVELSWIPDNKYSEHIICVTAVDTYGVESAQQRCFIIDFKTQEFNYTLIPGQDKPYFLNAPSTEDLIKCPAEATCIIPIFVKSIRNVTFASIVESFTEHSALGPIRRILRNGEYVYQFDFSFRHSLYEQVNLCLEASDDKGIKTERLCFKTTIEPPDPCFSSPCKNGAECQQRNDSSGLFDCLCTDGYNGKYCENEPDVCGRNPCIHGTCFNTGKTFFCYCQDDSGNPNDYTGTLCDTKIDDCATNSCTNHSICIDGVNSYTCDCFPRYNGTDCGVDLCPTSNRATFCSDNNGCSQLCSNSGVCFQGQCKCTVGFTGTACESRVGNIATTLNPISFVPPTPKSGAIIVCSIANSTIIACGVHIYVATKIRQAPTVTMSASDDIQASTVGPMVRQALFQGVDDVFTSYVTFGGRPQDMQGHYVCITATDSSNGTLKDTVCYQLKFDLDGGLNPLPQAHFVESSPQKDSKYVCYIKERCSVTLYTNKVSTCKDVISAGVKFSVFAPLDNQDGRCVTEVLISTETIDDFTGCFRASDSNYEERCFQLSIIDKKTDPCASSGDIINGYCQNHGLCFTTGPTDYQCFCNGEGYTGKNCSKGPCVREDNRCSTESYCITDDHVITCMCKNGFTGDTCDTDIGGTFAPSTTDGARFINTGKPKEVICNRNRLCGTYAIVGGGFHAGESPVVIVGFVSPELEIKDFKTISQNSSSTLFQTFITFMPKEEGTFDLCLQTLNNARVNKDETCFVIRVTEGTDTVYGLLENPHFVHPSLQPDSIVECKAGTECHVMYTVTPGNGHSQECIDFKVKIPETEKSHVFTTCRPCVDGNVSNHECTIDIAIRPISDPRVCVSLQIATSGIKGEERCFSVSSIPALDAKKGCQLLECQNDGFCDGHDPNHPMCYCRPGFAGRNCQTDLKIPIGGCRNTFMYGPVTTEIECSSKNCTYPFQACRDSSVAIKSGFASPQLDVYIPSSAGSSSTSCECRTTTSNIVSTSTGRFSFCLQLKDSQGFLHDEICPNMVVKGADAKNEVDKDKPYFITPTLPTGSSVLCEVTSACQLTVYYTDGAKFGSLQECPSLKQSSSNLLDGLHIFPPTHMTTECKNELTYQPQTNITAGETRLLCLTVAVPGKQGEERCFRLKFVNNITDEVKHPCKGVTCFGDSVCIADQLMKSGACVCPSGYVGGNCSTVYNATRDLPGIINFTEHTDSPVTPHFDPTHGIIRQIACIVGTECIVPISYTGLETNPPIKGFCNNTLSVGSTVVSPDLNKINYHELLVNVSGSEGEYKCCYQTTVNGTTYGMNIDEICFLIVIQKLDQSLTTTPKNTSITRPKENTTFICLPDVSCHLTIASQIKDGKCEQVKECGNGILGAHVFQTHKGSDGQCVTDVAYTASGITGLKDLCITPGRGAEEHHVFLDVQNSTEFGPCQKLHCTNAGTCMSEASTPVCACKPGFTGQDCDSDIDECARNPCEHNGTCLDGPNNYTCTCVPAYTGGNCEIDIVAKLCANVTCSANAVCKADHQLAGGTCICPIGFVGERCSEAVNSTKDLDGVTSFTQPPNAPDTPHFDSTHGIIKHVECIEGRKCIVPISYNGLESKPPLKGYCNITATDVVQTPNPNITIYHELLIHFSGSVGLYKCCYQTTVNGSAYGINIDEICFDVKIKPNDPSATTSPTDLQFIRPMANTTFICLPNATCHVTIATPTQNGVCDPIRECNNVLPSTQIVLLNNANGECLTDIGYTTNGLRDLGDLCLTSGQGKEQHVFFDVHNSTEFGPCQKLHCQNGGKCISQEGSGAQCTCEPGFTGHDCGSDVDDCSPSLCQNGGTCRDAVNTYTCECGPGYTGSNCSINIDECASNPCQNNAACRDGLNNYTCTCSPAYTGGNCEIDIVNKLCANVVCYGASVCKADHRLVSGTCICPIGFVGEHCSEAFNSTKDLDGVTNFTHPPYAPDTPHFDSTHGIVKHVECIDGHRCIVQISYNGLESKPPLKGYCNISVTDVAKTPNPNKTIYHELLIDFSGGVGFYKCCYQTTLNGSSDGINVDEICVDVKIKPNDPSATASPTDLQFIRPMANTTFICLPNATCHVTIATPPQNGACDPIRECNTVLPRTQIVLLNNANGECLTDIGYTTNGLQNSGDLCLTSGQGREQHVFFDVHNSTEFGPCQKLHCQNGGKCISQGGSGPQCTCEPGFTGHDCGSNVDDCNPSPCHNGGTCRDDVNNYTCDCVPGYTGSNCSINVDDCNPSPCTNGGTCRDALNNYTCECVPGYTGSNCSINVDECNPSPCQNGGTCRDAVNNYTCDCVPGYTGSNCSINVDDCNPSPCTNGGTCRDAVNNYTCECVPGYTGSNCSINVDDCNPSPCQNGGTCRDAVNNYTCDCVLGYFSSNCSINVDDCNPSPCQNGGTCHDTVNTYTCDCVPGYTGLNCSINIDDCINSPCNNGGTCTDGINSYTCMCVLGWEGDRCDQWNAHAVDECMSHPCQNNATCNDGSNSYSCICRPGYEGNNCQNDINKCASDPCQHDAICTDVGNGYQCACPDNHPGPQCELDLGGSLNEPRTPNNQNPPRFTEFTIPEIIRCQVNAPCAIVLPVDGEPNNPPVLLNGYYSPGLIVHQPKTTPSYPPQCNNNGKCSYDAFISVKATYVGMFKYCVQTTDYHSVNADELCYKIESFIPNLQVPGDSNFVQPPTLPNNSTMACPVGKPCLYIIETKKPLGGQCNASMKPEHTPDNTMVNLVSSADNATCKYHVVFTPAASLNGTKVELCFSSNDRHCTNVNVNSKEAIAQSSGPCSDLHCANGVCKSENGTATCRCKPGFSGHLCEKEIEECTISSVPSSITCSPSPCVMDILVTGSQSRPVVEYKSGSSVPAIKGNGSSYTISYDIPKSLSPAKVCLNISARGTSRDCAVSACSRVIYSPTEIGIIPVLNCTTPDGGLGECNTIVVTTKPLQNGTCPELFVHRDSTLEQVHIFDNELVSQPGVSPHCMAAVSAFTPNGSPQKLCITDTEGNMVCMNTTVSKSVPANKKCVEGKDAGTRAKKQVKMGLVSCVCTMDNKPPVEIIKKKPLPPSESLSKAAGVGAGGMAGAMVVGVIIYLAIKKIKGNDDSDSIDVVYKKPLPMSRPPSRLFPSHKVTPNLPRRLARPQLDF